MIKLIKRLNGKEVGWILSATVFVFVQVFLDLKIPEFMSEITTVLQTPNSSVSDILTPGLSMLSLSLASLAVSVFIGFSAARVAASFSTRLRQNVFEKVIDLSPAQVNEFSVSSLLTRTTNDITQITMLIAMGLQVVVKGPVMAVWAMSKIADKNQAWLLLTSGAVLLIVSVLTVLLIFAFPKQRIAQTLTDKLNASLRAMLTGVRVVRAYNAERYEENKFEAVNTQLTDLNLYMQRLMAIMSPVMTLLMGGLTLGIYWIGAILINEAKLLDRLTLFTDMIVFSSYAMQVIFGFMMMMVIFFILPRALVSARRINEVLDEPSRLQFGELVESAANDKGSVIFKNVSFAYADDAEKVLDNVSFEVKAGQTAAFIGSTGSGKSTLVNLIARFFDVTEGEILINHEPIANYTHETLNNIVSYIPQKAILFSGTIDSNLMFGDSSATPLHTQDKERALLLAQALPFVQEKEDGLESAVAQNGTNFSGGQRQRLTIARALARKGDIIIFDDSFSALDYKTDRVLRAQLAKETQGITKLIVAQRISTIMDADLIVVLDEGKVVGQGTHKELLETNAVYQEIAYSQLSKEELSRG
ncbi:ABC transporter ATP-binding protein [Carnobacteriaceae bacterium zg-ZUI252]|nr:ABC transporter ATP-binding protein [Carnobacteriaceae bacterium zg-ZUI252]